MNPNPDLTALAQAALQFIENDSVVGLGSGRAARCFVELLGRRVQEGLRVRAVCTSSATATLAAQWLIPLVRLDEIQTIDVAVDGADEVDPELNLIKGWGGALVREKIVAAAARRLIILVGVEKIVPVLGARGMLPIEVIPFALGWCQRRLTELGYPCTRREVNGQLFLSDNDNPILDCKITELADPAALEQTLRSLAGVVATGLFLGMANLVLIQQDDKVLVRQRPDATWGQGDPS